MTAIIGYAATISAIIIFCGSVWLLLAIVLGGRLAYFITASVTLAFLLIMGAVWSYGTPLGPVGVLPTWNPLDINDQPAELEFGPAAEYPEGPWLAPDTEDAAQMTQASELESAATELLAQSITEGENFGYDSEADVVVATDSARLLEQDGDTFGAVTLEPAPDEEGNPGAGDTLFVVMSYDPGNPLLMARQITAGTLVLFVLHLVGLSRSEKAVRRRKEEAMA